MSVSLKEMFKDKYVFTMSQKNRVKIYSDEQEYPFNVRGFIVNELLYYLKNEGYVYGLCDGSDMVVCIEDFMVKNGISGEKCVLSILEYTLGKYIPEDEIKCMWVVIPNSVARKLMDRYEVVEGEYSLSILTKSFDITLCYLTKFKGEDVYVGYVYAPQSYYGMYKDYLDLGDRVLCDDKWLTGRLLYGIKSDMLHLDLQLGAARNMLRKLKSRWRI